MRTIIGTAAVLGAVLVGTTTGALPHDLGSAREQATVAVRPAPLTAANSASEAITPEALTGVVRRVCAACHNDQLKTGNLSLSSFDVAKAPEHAEIAEKMIRKLRAGMMPPPGVPRPAGDTLEQLAATLETIMDQHAASAP